MGFSLGLRKIMKKKTRWIELATTAREKLSGTDLSELRVQLLIDYRDIISLDCNGMNGNALQRYVCI
jgi:hypothetical protein